MARYRVCKYPKRVWYNTGNGFASYEPTSEDYRRREAAMANLAGVPVSQATYRPATHDVLVQLD